MAIRCLRSKYTFGEAQFGDLWGSLSSLSEEVEAVGAELRDEKEWSE
jgi:hypothetical protein